MMDLLLGVSMLPRLESLLMVIAPSFGSGLLSDLLQRLNISIPSLDLFWRCNVDEIINISFVP